MDDREVLWYRFAEDNKRDTCNGYCNPLAFGSEEIDRDGRRQGGKGDIDGLIPCKNRDEESPGAPEEFSDGGRKRNPFLLHLVEMKRGKKKQGRLGTGKECR